MNEPYLFPLKCTMSVEKAFYLRAHAHLQEPGTKQPAHIQFPCVVTGMLVSPNWRDRQRKLRKMLAANQVIDLVSDPALREGIGENKIPHPISDLCRLHKSWTFMHICAHLTNTCTHLYMYIHTDFRKVVIEFLYCSIDFSSLCDSFIIFLAYAQ